MRSERAAPDGDDRRRIRFDWTAAHHFAAVGYLRRHSRRSLLLHAVMLLGILLAGLALIDLLEGGLTHERIAQFAWLLVAFEVLGALGWAAFTSQPMRRILLRRTSAVPCALQYDADGIEVAIGKSRLRYAWRKVRSIGESVDYVFVQPSAAACFAIPKSAFGSAGEAENFAAAMRRFVAP